MFVSGMLKKCINLLSHDNSKDNNKNSTLCDTSHNGSEEISDTNSSVDECNTMIFNITGNHETLDTCTFTEISPRPVVNSTRPSVLEAFDPFYQSLPLDSSENDSFKENCEHLNGETEWNKTENLVSEIINNVNPEDEPEILVNIPLSDSALCTIEPISSDNDKPEPKIMTDLDAKVHQLEEEQAQLKLQLNASEQLRASLELQLTQKEEIVIKTQTELLRKDQATKQELKQLKDKLEEKTAENEGTPTKELQETVKSLKAREAKLMSELNARKNDEHNYRKILEDYEKALTKKSDNLQKVNEEHETVTKHLANLELAFSDVHQKYERCKQIILGYKSNEDTLRQALALSEENLLKSEQKYESLKAHAKAQIEKSNQEVLMMRDNYDGEVNKLNAVVKRLDIKNASLIDLLDQKNKECAALAALCDEVTGKM
ncbi:transforming acidic coiled-coil-containing protein 3-like isoform X3 [Photinus pyralis]|uniref:transforming acidic coiled-coil-containing protein 3-like isoform X3 n=1 Tax=Photinus pyralis TaxID=7054 RepID=UPI0012676B7A|nr:transforming acidic coiled-coil-containing protein 3-like isoform X3 [Photinus pyralis]